MAVAGGREEAAHVVAAGGVLDLQHLRAEVGKLHRAPGTGQHAGEIEDANAFESGQGRGSFFLAMRAGVQE